MKYEVKVNHADHKIPFTSVKKVLSRWYAPDTRVKVTFLQSGLTTEMDLSLYYVTIGELCKVNDAFGILNDDHYMLLDADLLEYTIAYNTTTKCEIWKQKRKCRAIADPVDPAEEPHEGESPKGGSNPAKRS